MARVYLIAAAIVATGIIAAVVYADPRKYSDAESLNRTRACVYPIGGWTIVDCSAVAAAQSAQLTANARYVVQCGDDSYIATGDQSTDEADSNDGWLPSGAWLEFATTDTVRYLSCLNKNSNSDCRYWECQ